MKVQACKAFSSTRLGNIGPGRVLDLPDSLATLYLRRGLVQLYETKIIVPAPMAGPLSASHPDPVSPQTTASTSDAGDKPKRRRARASSSRSTNRGGAQGSQTTSTQLTESGGDTAPPAESDASTPSAQDSAGCCGPATEEHTPNSD